MTINTKTHENAIEEINQCWVTKNLGQISQVDHLQSKYNLLHR